MDTERYHGPLDPSLVRSIVALWNAEYPVQLHMSEKAFTAFVDRGGSVTHYLEREGGHLLGWGMCFDRDSERWFSLLVVRAAWGRGIGTKIIRDMQADEPALCGWVIDHDRDTLASGEPYRSPLAFYLKLGFYLVPDIRWEANRISAAKIRWTILHEAPGPGRVRAE